MSKKDEALKLALEALEGANAELEYLNDPKGFVSIRQEQIMDKARNALNALREALTSEAKEQPAQQALDKMAENARELGLDYEPARQEPEYVWPTVADYERDVGFQTNEAFRMAWDMARTTNTMLGIKEKNT